jgi:hypothetical protein
MTTLFEAFGLSANSAALLNAFVVTDAYIGGGAALACHMRDPILPEQDLDIFYTPSADAPALITQTLFDMIFCAAGYTRRSDTTGGYKQAKALHIETVINWYHMTLKRKIQVVVRSASAPADCPAYGSADFDICQFYIKYDPDSFSLRLFYNPHKSALTDETVAEIRSKRVMRIGNLKGQDLSNSLRRLRKYYHRGFAFEDERVTTCSCACGHEHTAKKSVRLTYSEAAAVVRAAHARANPVRWFPLSSDSEDEASLTPPLARANATPTRPMVRPPPLEIPPILEITDTLETPPRPKRTLPLRKCRKDDSWIVEKPE